MRPADTQRKNKQTTSDVQRMQKVIKLTIYTKGFGQVTWILLSNRMYWEPTVRQWLSQVQWIDNQQERRNSQGSSADVQSLPCERALHQGAERTVTWKVSSCDRVLCLRSCEHLRWGGDSDIFLFPQRLTMSPWRACRWFWLSWRGQAGSEIR